VSPFRAGALFIDLRPSASICGSNGFASVNALENLALNLRLIPRTYADVRNPQVLLKDYLGLVAQDYHVELRDGTTLELRHGTADKGVVKEIFLLDHYRFALDRLKPGGVVVDVGAQIGVFSVYVARRGPRRLTVHSFEPMSANHALLKRNLELNQLNHVTAHNAAVAASAGRFKLYLSSDNTGMHSLYGTGSDFEEVEGRSFNTLYDSLGIKYCDVLKLDCEGAEHEILMTATDDTLGRTGAIVMEYHDEAKLPELLNRLERAGFSTELPRNGAPMVHAWR